MDNRPDPRRALYGLYGILSSVYRLNEELQLFAREPKDRSPAETRAATARERVARWSLDQLNAEGGNVGELEATADRIGSVVSQHLQTARSPDPKDQEAVYLYALTAVLTEFCKIYAELGRQCSETPIPALWEASAESLGQDYGIKMAPDFQGPKPLLDSAHELANRLQPMLAGKEA
jgi:hypothetical protein